MTSLESHNWKLSVHRPDSSHSITSGHLEGVKRGWLAWDYLEKPCAGKYYTHQQSSLSDELTLSNLLFTLPVKIFSIRAHKAPMAGTTPSPLLPSDTFCFRIATVWFNLPQDMLVRPAWHELQCQCVKQSTWMIAEQHWLLVVVSGVWEKGSVHATKYACFYIR